MYCDFCNSHQPQVCYIVKPGRMIVAGKSNPVVMSTNPHWSACPTCAQMIDHNQRYALAQRAREHANTVLPTSFVYLMHQMLFWNTNPVKHGPAHEADDAPTKGH